MARIDHPVFVAGYPGSQTKSPELLASLKLDILHPRISNVLGCRFLQNVKTFRKVLAPNLRDHRWVDLSARPSTVLPKPFRHPRRKAFFQPRLAVKRALGQSPDLARIAEKNGREPEINRAFAGRSPLERHPEKRHTLARNQVCGRFVA